MPELSVVVPVFNEATIVGRFMEMLDRQENIDMEVVVSDGGSTDGTATLCPATRFPVTIVSSKKGRGRQMNAGAARAGGELLLFLHADSRFEDTKALRGAVDLLRNERAGTGAAPAGRFRLRFDGIPADHPGFRFHEMKARLGRRGCIHGDQGFMIFRDLFVDLGKFDEDLPVLEDTLFAERMRRHGGWLLFPADIWTSPRRFLTEGLARRDILNAIIVNLGLAEWQAPLREVPSLYRTQCNSGRLDLLPFFLLFRRMLEELPADERRAVWERTADFVRDNAWQIPLALDILRSVKLRPADALEKTPVLDFFDRRIYPVLAGTGGTMAAKLLVKSWFFGSIFIWKLPGYLRLRR